jgi:hypothetical protein
MVQEEFLVEGSTPTITNVIEFIDIATTGNATDFGDLLAATNGSSCIK